ncbi:ferredoxin [Micromonospora sp. NPDC126480]|uniref:ferredoxin n=1 Tax=Micromonospora sp. NPDC126480 TaxID=3155312 RepID=UPI0033263712
MRVVADRDVCQSYGLCELTAPTMFRVGDDDVVEVLVDGDLPAELRAAAVDAAGACPVHALRVV